MVVLSLFPGVDLLGRAFEAEGFCIVRGPDLLWGGDIRRFDPPAGVFCGIVGGSPCQDFSQARRAPPTGLGRQLMRQFARVVKAAQPAWWLLENVARAPDLRIAGYGYQRIDVNQGWYCGVSRLRHFQFGSLGGERLDIPRGDPVRGAEPAALAHDGRSFRELCRLQGLPDDYDLPGFTVEQKKVAVGNGVPMPMGRTVARAVRRAFSLSVSGQEPPPIPATRRSCACGCGRSVGGKQGRQRYYSAACRKRAERQRRGGRKTVMA